MEDRDRCKAKRAWKLIAAISQHWRTILIFLVLSLLIGMLVMYVDPHIGQD